MRRPEYRRNELLRTTGNESAPKSVRLELVFFIFRKSCRHETAVNISNTVGEPLKVISDDCVFFFIDFRETIDEHRGPGMRGGERRFAEYETGGRGGDREEDVKKIQRRRKRNTMDTRRRTRGR